MKETTNRKNRVAGASSTTADCPVVVLGAGITALGVVRCLGRAGIPVYCASAELAYITRSRWYRRTKVQLKRYAELAPFLAQLPFERAVLMACSDDWVLAAARLEGELAARFPISQATPEILATFLDKGRLAQLLVQLDLPHPHTSVLTSENDLTQIGAGEITRYFLKPCNSQAFSARYQVKAFRISSPADARQKLRRVLKDGLQVLLQEFIPGPATNHYFIDGFVDRSGCIRARFARQRIRMYPLEFGNSSYLTTIPLATVADAAATLAKLIKHVGYRGVFSAEFKFDARTGTFKLLEINVRPWWYIEFAANCGVDICRMAYDDALGRAVFPVENYDIGVNYVYHWLDLSTAIRMMRRGELGAMNFICSWLDARQAVFKWDDPQPAVVVGFGEIRGKLAEWFRAG